jgi:prepilin-type N-terminal cleavage/methylation domain-containing protein
MMIRRRTARNAAAASARAGFTLMELLVVVAILVVLVSVATPLYFGYLEKSKIKIAKAGAVSLAQELQRFQIDNGSLPPVGSWDGLALNKAPLDPWNKYYVWTTQEMMSGGIAVHLPVVYSTGPTGDFGPDGPCSSAGP